MREIESERGLRISAAITLDPGRGAAERTPSIGADDQAGGDASAAVERNGHTGIGRFHRAGFVLDPDKRRELFPATIERGHEMPVLDIVAERFEADLGRGKA